VAYSLLVAALGERTVSRGYRALVWGHPAAPNGMIDAPVGRDHRDPLRMAVVIDGKPARTRYSTVRLYTRPAEVAELECQLETGRTHQIRVHLAAAGHPVVGDGAYGGIRTAVVSPRPFLHAAKLGFAHPVTQQPMDFTSPLPDDLTEVLSSLS
jgi:23S rRNA pseudouridine1911/1915/1917 synthase